VVRINLIGTYNVARLAAARIATTELADALDDGERGVMVNTASGGRLRRPGGPGGLQPPARAAWSA
jgi:NAD(P)-dependent dehydrogenase (short-subunit alcohol dehydrogenase family)